MQGHPRRKFFCFFFAFFVTIGSAGHVADAQSAEPILLSAEGGRLSVAQKTTIDLMVSADMKDVFVSDPAVMDVLVVNSRTIRLLPGDEGVADLMIKGAGDGLIGSAKIMVVPPESSTVTIHRRGQLSTYSCRWGICGFVPKAVEQAFESVAVLLPDTPNMDDNASEADDPPVLASTDAEVRTGIASGFCASQQGLCIAQCNGNGQCIGNCAASLGRCMGNAAAQSAVPAANAPGLCIGNCASEQGICIANCNGDGQCIGNCAAAHGQCTSQCN
jgi:hypothetical protein